MIGQTLGVYRIEKKIGEGGMGQVYKATDTKLNRQVALKILPDAFASDPDRVARFQREAQVLASLNHPGIAQIHGLEEQDPPPPGYGGQAVKALVLELVEGPTLADRIAQGPIPVDEALPIAKQIAEALEAAHEQGIIQCATKVHTTSGWKIRPSTCRYRSVATCTAKRGDPPVEAAGTDISMREVATPRAVTCSES